MDCKHFEIEFMSDCSDVYRVFLTAGGQNIEWIALWSWITSNPYCWSSFSTKVSKMVGIKWMVSFKILPRRVMSVEKNCRWENLHEKWRNPSPCVYVGGSWLCALTSWRQEKAKNLDAPLQPKGRGSETLWILADDDKVGNLKSLFWDSEIRVWK